MKPDQTVKEGTAEPTDPPAAERAEQAKGTNEAAPLVAGADVNPSRVDPSGAAQGAADGETAAKEGDAAKADGASEAAKPAGATEQPETTEPAGASKRQEAPKSDGEGGAADAAAGAAAQRAADAKPAAGADADKEAKRKAAAEARAARAAAKAKADGGDGEEPKPPSPNQPLLDRLVEILKQEVGEDAVESAWINPNGDTPTVQLRAERLVECARVLRDHPELQLNYLRNMAGVDMETHMEVVYHLISLDKKINYSVKVKTDRERPSVPSVTALWKTADWNEREIYDLLGIEFPGHPNLRRILMPDDWEGYPLRKDYVPADPEV